MCPTPAPTKAAEYLSNARHSQEPCRRDDLAIGPNRNSAPFEESIASKCAQRHDDVPNIASLAVRATRSRLDVRRHHQTRWNRSSAKLALYRNRITDDKCPQQCLLPPGAAQPYSIQCPLQTKRRGLRGQGLLEFRLLKGRSKRSSAQRLDQFARDNSPFGCRLSRTQKPTEVIPVNHSKRGAPCDTGGRLVFLLSILAV